MSRPELLYAVHARLGAAGIEAPLDQEAKVDELLEILIIRGMARYRLDPVTPTLSSTPLRLDETARRLAELVRWDDDPYIFNVWHEGVSVPHVDRHLLPSWTARGIATHWSSTCCRSPWRMWSGSIAMEYV